MIDPKSGEFFIDLIEQVSGLKYSHPMAVKFANSAWDSWEEQGFSRGNDTSDVIAQPHIIFNNYYSDIIKANNLEYKEIYYCLAKTRELNAYASTTQNGDYVVVFDSELYAFINDIIITCIVCVYSHPSDGEIEFYFNHIFNLLLEFKGLKKSNLPDKAGNEFLKIITKDYELTMLGSYCGAAIYAFIICHELSHHMLGHTKLSKIKMAVFSKNNTEYFDMNETSFKEEYEADEMGFKLYVNVIKKYENLDNLKINNQFFSIPLFFFKILELLELLDLFSENTTNNNTHPNPKLRHQRLKDIKNSINFIENTEFYDALMEVFSKLYEWSYKKIETKNKESPL